MSFTALYVNDVDTAASFGLIVETPSPQGWLDSQSIQDRTVPLLARAGSLIVSLNPLVKPRVVNVSGKMRAATNAALRANVLALQALVSRGTVELRFLDDATRVMYARCQTFAVVATGPTLSSTHCGVQMSFQCVDPYLYDLDAQVIGFTTLATSCPLGSAPSAPLIRVAGPGTNPTITYRDIRGNAIRTMALSITLAAADYIEVDSQLLIINKSVSGTITNGMANLSSGDFIALDPSDGDYSNSIWPTLEVTAGQASAHYRKAWL